MVRQCYAVITSTEVFYIPGFTNALSKAKHLRRQGVEAALYYQPTQGTIKAIQSSLSLPEASDPQAP